MTTCRLAPGGTCFVGLDGIACCIFGVVFLGFGTGRDVLIFPLDGSDGNSVLSLMRGRVGGADGGFLAAFSFGPAAFFFFLSFG